MKFSAVLVLLSLTHVTAFKFLSNWKGIPRPSDVIKKRQAKNRFGGKKIVVITGTSSGLGRKTARELLRTGDYHVVGAVRDLDKMATVALDDDFPKEAFTPMHVDLNSFDSVRQFCDDLKKFKCNKPVDRLICNVTTQNAAARTARAALCRLSSADSAPLTPLQLSHPTLTPSRASPSCAATHRRASTSRRCHMPSGRRTATSSKCRSTTSRTF